MKLSLRAKRSNPSHSFPSPGKSYWPQIYTDEAQKKYFCFSMCFFASLCVILFPAQSRQAAEKKPVIARSAATKQSYQNIPINLCYGVEIIQHLQPILPMNRNVPPAPSLCKGRGLGMGSKKAEEPNHFKKTVNTSI